MCYDKGAVVQGSHKCARGGVTGAAAVNAVVSLWGSSAHF